ncbi:MAG TPA: hypothetical protein VM165_02640, partial [Planctomycetaceae bacterium]|nr:hypothetical protein [Planctomycetaceae bacterium]
DGRADDLSEPQRSERTNGLEREAVSEQSAGSNRDEIRTADESRRSVRGARDANSPRMMFLAGDRLSGTSAGRDYEPFAND